MDGVLWWLAQNTLTIAVAIVVVALLCLLAPRRPALQHLLWLVVMVKFLTPPVVVWPWALGEIADSWSEAKGSAEEAAADLRSDRPPASHALDYTPADLDALGLRPSRPGQPLESIAPEIETAPAGAALVEGLLPTTAVTAEEQHHATAWANWRWAVSTIFVVWAAGALLAAIWQARRLYRFHRLARRALPAPRPLLEEVQTVAACLGLRAPPACVSDRITTPLVWSLLRLVLLWPARLAGEAAAQRGVIAHELAHVKRRDHWVSWLVLAAGCVWWWNPLFWLVRRRLHEAAEMACDALALDLSPEARQSYAELLLEWSQWSPQATPAPAVLGASFGARRTFRRRLAMILNDRISSKPSWPGWALAGLLALASLPAWAWGQVTKPVPIDRAAAADEPAPKADPREPAVDSLADPDTDKPRPRGALSLAERLRQLNAAGKALEEERASRKEGKVDVHQVAKDLQQARRDLRLIRTGGPIDAGKLVKAQRALADLRATMRESKRSPELMVTETYLHMLGRRPSDAEARSFQKQLAAKPDSDEIYDDVFWAVLNSKEFLDGERTAAQEPPTDPSKPTAANTPGADTKSLQEVVALLTAQLKAQEAKLQRVEAERAELLDQMKLLSDRVHELQSTTKTRPAAPPPTLTTPRALDAPAASDPSRPPPGTVRPGGPAASGATDDPSDPRRPPSATTPAKRSVDPFAKTGDTRPAPAASTASRASADGAVDVISLATAYIDAQAAHDLAKARAGRAEKLRNKGFASQEQIETDLLTAATSERKLKLLRAIVEAEVAAAKAELDYVDRAIAEGVLPKSKRIGIEARLRVLGLIVEPEKSK